MQNYNIKVSFIIPTFNSEKSIRKTLISILESTSLKKEIIIIDDLSKDKTVSVIEDFILEHSQEKINLIKLSKNTGPGVARNIGYQKAQGDYTIFFDSDDLLKKNVIDNAIHYLDMNNIDVGFFKYDFVYNGVSRKMHEKDESLYQKAISVHNGELNIKDYPQLLSFTNYPWNKITKTSFLRGINFKFSELRLHEDILAHWLILMNANKIKMFDKSLCDYFLFDSSANMTNDKSELRLQCIDAIEEIYDILKSKSCRILFIPIFMSFYLDLIGWVLSIIDSNLKETLLKRCRNLILKFSLEDLFSIKNDSLYYDNIYNLIKYKKETK